MIVTFSELENGSFFRFPEDRTILYKIDSIRYSYQQICYMSTGWDSQRYMKRVDNPELTQVETCLT